MSTVFVDTSGFFALYARNDADHPQAVDLFRRASSERWQLVTTNAVVMETHALLLNRVRDGRAAALRFLDDMRSSGVRVERVGEADEAAAIALIRAHADKSYSPRTQNPPPVRASEFKSRLRHHAGIARAATSPRRRD